MKSKKLNSYDSNVPEGVNNEYPTPPNSFRQPVLNMICGVRNSGKSYLTNIMLEQAYKDKTFNRIYLISPSFASNKTYFGKYVLEEDVFLPTKDSIDTVMKLVDAERDEWEAFLEKKKEYEKYKKDIKTKNIDLYDDDTLIFYLDMGFLDGEKPTWKYGKEEPPKSLLILDDCLGTPAILQSSGLTRLAMTNRHQSPLKETHSNRSACGLAVIILCQTYKMAGGAGIGRALRENVSLLTLFKNKQEKQIESIKDELANVVDVCLFDRAYNYATKDKYGSLTIDFNPKTPCKTFRKNLRELIIFDELGGCQCPVKEKKEKEKQILEVLKDNEERKD